MSFENLNLIEPILSAIKKEGYSKPTDIQAQAIPHVLTGKDLLGCAQTGTGKTAAFAIPILQELTKRKTGHHVRSIKALVISPTRELALQISESFSTYGRHTDLRNTVIYGGVSYRKQAEKLNRGVDILIATPGRLMDLMNQGLVNLSKLEFFVLDEADRMLDMGFIVDIKKIIEKIPEKRQSLFFSATMSPEIIKLAEKILNSPEKVEIQSKTVAVDTITQGVYFVSRDNKKALLKHLLQGEDITSALVFTRTKSRAEQISKMLNDAKIHAEAIHGDKSQNARQRALSNFKLGKSRVLVATDVAARGLDIDQLSHVINYEIPEYSENYIHRIGRTGRAGLSGTALSFCDREERIYLKDINKLMKIPVPVIEDHPFAVKDEHSSSEKTSSFRNSRGSGRKKSFSSNKPGNWNPPAEGKKRRSNSSDKPGNWNPSADNKKRKSFSSDKPGNWNSSANYKKRESFSTDKPGDLNSSADNNTRKSFSTDKPGNWNSSADNKKRKSFSSDKPDNWNPSEENRKRKSFSSDKPGSWNPPVRNKKKKSFSSDQPGNWNPPARNKKRRSNSSEQPGNWNPPVYNEKRKSNKSTFKKRKITTQSND